MQITDLYQTKITCSTYNANIDSTDTVITVKLIDFNGNAVTNKSVTLTCDKGYFNKKDSTPISGTTTKSITLTTDSSGEITGTWTASEWGLATFSTNNSNIQIMSHGLKHVVYNEYYQYWYDDHNVYLKINTSPDTVSFPTTFTEFGVQRFIPEALRPKERVVTQTFSNTNLLVAVSTDGGIYRRSATGSSVNAMVQAYLQWHY